ncbi:hypothetical protein WOLCODRAFT_140170 [Wolfiporia cocos MD-104 SS10]|uniref:Uncharacterized protein n=1 Tax=Wolfiporia cocos (strain MD-104) TaxID=742152 RepID=A0A2H3J1E9_WOLCO|nr:hypothetical protein WOLCODRAFT_140170 [Wolfiporia cocos MD-104 SS10]
MAGCSFLDCSVPCADCGLVGHRSSSNTSGAGQWSARGLRPNRMMVLQASKLITECECAHWHLSSSRDRYICSSWLNRRCDALSPLH